MLSWSPQRAQPYPCCQRSGWELKVKTASDKLEEGGDDVKSSWPHDPQRGYTRYNGAYKEKRPRESKRTS